MGASGPITAVRGLSTADARERARIHGPNTLPAPRPRSVWSRVASQLRDPLVLVLLGAMAVTAILRDLPDLLVIALVVTVNTTVGVVQEVRADRAVAALRSLAAPTARVLRDGRELRVAAAELVPGDLVRLDAGDVVPADLELVEAVRVSVDESALTGESVPVGKQAVADDPQLSEVSAGTVLTSGRAAGVVLRTGLDSALGRIAALVAAQPRRATPLQRRLARFGRVLAVLAVALSTLVMVAGLLRGLPWPEMLLSAVSLTVAAVPESLPAVVTLSLALGAHRMARRSAIARRLPAVETLGSVTVIAADKTGTLTEGTMSVALVALPDGTELRLGGRGYEPWGTVTGPTGPAAPAVPADSAPGAALEALARALMLCNDADVLPPGTPRPVTGPDARPRARAPVGVADGVPAARWQPIGDPMEAALVTAAARAGVDRSVRDAYPRLAELPFEPTTRRMTTLHATPDGRYLTVCKGAPESLLAPDGPVRLAQGERARLAAAAERLAEAGYRVLAVAARNTDRRPVDRLDRDLRLLGMVGLIDPLRAAAVETIGRFSDAGIRFIMITGDHPATAAAIARRLDLADRHRVAVGDEVSGGAVDPTEIAVFARTRPEQKLDIVRALQARGHVVAMTGDGVNDAPALRRADIGVAMGSGGTEAARQAADLVLADDNLATIGVAVEEGRRIHANIRRFLAYAVSGGLAEVLVMLVGPWLGLLVPLLPAQILWINMLTHGLPGVALGAEPTERGVMNRPPRRPDEAILGAGLGLRIGGTGLLIMAVSLIAARYAEQAGRPWQSVLFTVLGLAQLAVALVLRARPPGQGANWALDAAVALSVILQLAALWLAPLRELLGTSALTPREVLACAAVATVPALVLLGVRMARRAI